MAPFFTPLVDKNGTTTPTYIRYVWMLCRLIEECWNADPEARPTFFEIIRRLDKIVANCSKQGWWKDTFKLPWYVMLLLISSIRTLLHH